MPRRYWIPLRLREWPLQQHVHAAVTAWFDDGAPYGTSRKPHGPAVASHDEKQKAYTISCPTMRDGIPGIEVSTLSDGADSVMEWVASELPVLRLGRQREVLVGRPQVLMDRPWSRIAQEPAPLGSGWHVEFLTPTMFRTGEAVDLLPTPARVLGAAIAECGRNIPDSVPDESLGLFRHLRVSDLQLETSDLAFGRVTYPGLVGHIVFRCSDSVAAGRLAPLFAALPFTGVGSYRVRGLGCVEVVPLSDTSGGGYARRRTRGTGKVA